MKQITIVGGASGGLQHACAFKLQNPHTRVTVLESSLPGFIGGATAGSQHTAHSGLYYALHLADLDEARAQYEGLSEAQRLLLADCAMAGALPHDDSAGLFFTANSSADASVRARAKKLGSSLHEAPRGLAGRFAPTAASGGKVYYSGDSAFDAHAYYVYVRFFALQLGVELIENATAYNINVESGTVEYRATSGKQVYLSNAYLTTPVPIGEATKIKGDFVVLAAGAGLSKIRGLQDHVASLPVVLMRQPGWDTALGASVIWGIDEASQPSVFAAKQLDHNGVAFTSIALTNYSSRVESAFVDKSQARKLFSEMKKHYRFSETNLFDIAFCYKQVMLNSGAGRHTNASLNFIGPTVIVLNIGKQTYAKLMSKKNTAALMTHFAIPYAPVPEIEFARARENALLNMSAWHQARASATTATQFSKLTSLVVVDGNCAPQVVFSTDTIAASLRDESKAETSQRVHPTNQTLSLELKSESVQLNGAEEEFAEWFESALRRRLA